MGWTISQGNFWMQAAQKRGNRQVEAMFIFSLFHHVLHVCFWCTIAYVIESFFAACSL